MRARDNKQLRSLIQSYHPHDHTHHMGMHMFALVGLISFGIMSVPVFTESFTTSSEQQVRTAVAPVPVSTFPPVAIDGRSAIVYDVSTHEILYAHNATMRLPLASLTKLVTLYAIATNLSPGETVVISESALAQDGDSGFTLGEQFTARDLERMALVASSNDAAQALAEAGSNKVNTSETSLLASAIASAGLLQTTAQNATGLDVNTSLSGGYGSAQDIATLAGEILTVAPEVAQATTHERVSATSLQGVAHSLPNTNQSLGPIPSPLLSKTGFTDLAGGNLVVVFDVGIGHPVAVVVLGSTKEGRFSDVRKLVDTTLTYFALTHHQ